MSFSTKLKKNHSYITKVYTLDMQECTLLYSLIISALALGFFMENFYFIASFCNRSIILLLLR